ncbi:TetR/AcrR family transcriptional regulator [candidate division KSB1 bacterium]|nr:TetR/AcrR family transcriptional regulator [candidate division KSB1 bacterium]
MGIQERKEREKEQRRIEILDAAERVFFTKGMKSATMDEVAESAELSKGTLYLYYKNKDELLLALIYRGIQIMIEMFKEAIQGEGTGLEKSFRIGQAYFLFAKEYPDYYNLISHFRLDELDYQNADHNDSMAEQCSDCGNMALGLLSQIIKEGMEDGSIRSDLDSDQIATLLYGMTSGIIELVALKGEHLKNKHGMNLDNIGDQYFELIRCALEPDTKRS